MGVRDVVVIADTSSTGSHGAVNWVELPANINNLGISVELSGTAGGVINVYQSPFTGGVHLGQARQSGQRIFTMPAGASATYHVMDVLARPRFLAFTNSGTLDAHIVIKAHFVKE